MAIAYGAVLDGININSYIAVYYYYCSLLRFYGSVPLSSELTSVVSSKKVITLPTKGKGIQVSRFARRPRSVASSAQV